MEIMAGLTYFFVNSTSSFDFSTCSSSREITLVDGWVEVFSGCVISFEASVMEELEFEVLRFAVELLIEWRMVGDGWGWVHEIRR
jgi:hypothetical protein